MATRAITREPSFAAPDAVAVALLTHYDRHARILPWRTPPGAHERPDPYRVWLSEIMLQQTTVAAVIPYFDRFTTRWPDVRALAAADDADVMSAWAGLGYYARARNLLACARVVAADHDGQFPETEAALRALPGIGAYTAAAIAAIAFGERAAVVDGNVERVMTRLAALDTPLPAAKPAIRALADALTPDQRPGDFAQAVMDLGATICTPRSPRCDACPIAAYCAAYAAGDPTRYPVKPARQAKPAHQGIIWWIERDDQVLLITRPDRGLLGGMRALPSSDWSETPSETPPFPAAWTASTGTVRHVFTHFSLTLRVMRTQHAPDVSAAMPRSIWWPISTLSDAGLPTVFAKAAALALAEKNT